MSDALWPHALQHARLPCPLPTPGAYSDSCQLSWWCHPTISSSVIPFSCLQSFPALGSFLVSWFFTSGGQNFGASASESVPPVNVQDWFPLGLTGLISLQSKGLSRVFSNTTEPQNTWSKNWWSWRRNMNPQLQWQTSTFISQRLVELLDRKSVKIDIWIT